MSKRAKRILSLVLVMMLMLAAIPLASAEGEKLWTEEDTPDGWTKVINEGGVTLGYSKNSGLQLVEADGYAFKDLDRDGELDTFEDWRVDYEERAQALVDSGLLTTEFMMGLKMNHGTGGAANSSEVQDWVKEQLDLGYRHLRFPSGADTASVVAYNNLIQEYIESNDSVVVIPATFIADPLNGNGVSKWPTYLGVASTFDTEVATEYGQRLSEEWRALGLTMKVAPQIDLATEPRWKRIQNTFGEDPQLSIDMAQAMVNAWQSTYDEDGNDLGWGVDSVNTQIKHLMGEGAAEGGRESHTLDGCFNVYPGGEFYTHLLPFVACLNLPGETESASGTMTNYSIALDENGDAIGGERVATSFNRWKITELWREEIGFDGYIITDFGITGWHVPPDGLLHPGKFYGVETLTDAERIWKILDAGVDALGGVGDNNEDDMALAMEAYAMGVEQYGQEYMDEMMNESTVRILKTLFNVGVVDNPYLSYTESRDVVNSAENREAGFEAQVKSVIMLKNSNNLIQEAADDKLTVYIPWKYDASTQTAAPSFVLTDALQYFDVVTDRLGEPTGEADENGEPTYTEDDIIRASTEEIATCDFALVKIQSPQNGNPTCEYTEDLTVPEDYEYLPISLQYRPYTADSMYVRMESIGGLVTSREVQGTYGTETIYEKENRSYYGKTGIITNEGDLDYVLYAASVADKVVVVVDADKPMVFSEFEGEVDSILLSFGDIEDEAFFEIIAGNVEPSGLLPMQMPANMETVEAQYEDVPRDMECYVDADGNTYDFTFGLNWSGVIDDERVAKYNVEPISVTSVDELLAYLDQD